MFARSLVPLVLALACAAHPLLHVTRNQNAITIPLAKHFNFTGSTKIAARDRARARALLTGAQGHVAARDTVDGAALSNVLVSYIATVSIGSQATTYDLIVDTGSANTWVGAGKPFVSSSTTKPTGKNMYVKYGTGSCTGNEVLDQLSIGSLSLKSQFIGNALASDGFQGVDGILGIGPTGLTAGTVGTPLDILLGLSNELVPTVTDTAYSQGLISTKIVAISFEPPTKNGDVNGEITFGHTDQTKFTSTLNIMSVTSTAPASNYFGIDQSISYGDSHAPILGLTAGIVDTGTTLLMIATDAYNRYVEATGATYDSDVGLLTVTADQYNAMGSLYFTMNSKTYEFTKNAQIWPRSLNAQIHGPKDKIYLIVSDMGSESGSGLDFINGQVFLERFYTTYDSSNNQFGIATTAFTSSEAN